MDKPVSALSTRANSGHQFVVYSDACSGVPGALHERTFASVNSILRRLDPQPAFVCFPGDEIIGLVSDEDALRRQWKHWFETEMGWLDREAVPMYHTTGNHTVYNPMSESVYREVMAHLPQNGPPDQKSLSYFVRRDDLLMVFVNTLWLRGGGEGRVEIEWLERTLAAHEDARYKLAFGHHPVFSVNGFSGEYQRDIATEDGRRIWDVLVRHGVFAYVCSHILAFDVQVHEGVLQILTAGAGTAHRMPEETEYLHLVQAAIDDRGLRYQVLDTDGRLREWLDWPLKLPPSERWKPSTQIEHASLEPHISPTTAELLAWRITGTTADDGNGTAQSLIIGWNTTSELPAIWIGLRGSEQRVSVLLAPTPGRSPHLWTGPYLEPGSPFDVQVAIHTGMGPGGILWRWDDASPWSSLTGCSAWGAEHVPPVHQWIAGLGESATHQHQPFRGPDLQVTWCAKQVELRRT